MSMQFLNKNFLFLPSLTMYESLCTQHNYNLTRLVKKELRLPKEIDTG